MKKTLALWGLVACAASPAWAQFELPKAPERAASSAGGFSAPAAPAAPQRLSFQYNYLVEITSTFKHDPDLDRRLRDDIQLLKPKLTGSFTYRPTNWLAATVEVTAKREYAIQEEASTTLPSGDVTTPPRRQSSLRVEQLLITARHSPFELNVGRRNYEDDRHFLFDGSLDVVALNYRHEDWRGELMIGRDIFWQWDALQHIDKQPIEMALLQAEYRGFEDNVLIAYALKRNDRTGNEGRPVSFGLRAFGKPTATFSYWSEFALMRGSDEAGRKLRAHALEVGGTYRFASLPHDPNLTLSYAEGSGGANADDTVNHTFRQTGLQTNEARFIGLGKFRPYGEVINTELSNLKIATIGLGARAAPGLSLDLIYHRYRLNAIATDVRNWGFTAQMNTVPGQESRDVGQEVDLVVGVRGMFGVRRLGLNFRMGKFFPGKAFQTASGTGVRRADPGFGIVAKLLY